MLYRFSSWALCLAVTSCVAVLYADEPGQALDTDLPQANESLHQGNLNAVREVGPSKYWLGVYSDPVEPDLQTHHGWFHAARGRVAFAGRENTTHQGLA